MLLDNGAHESTGGQATVSRGVSFAAVASACGYAAALEVVTLEMLDDFLVGKTSTGMRFARVSIRTGTPDDLPRPAMTPVDVKLRLMTHIASPRSAA